MFHRPHVHRFIYKPRPDKRDKIEVPAKTPTKSDEFDDLFFSGTGMNNITVFEQEIGPEFSGLFDHNGDPLFRYPVKFPIGFRVRSDEELLEIEFEKSMAEIEALAELGLLEDLEDDED